MEKREEREEREEIMTSKNDNQDGHEMQRKKTEVKRKRKGSKTETMSSSDIYEDQRIYNGKTTNADQSPGQSRGRPKPDQPLSEQRS